MSWAISMELLLGTDLLASYIPDLARAKNEVPSYVLIIKAMNFKLINSKQKLSGNPYLTLGAFHLLFEGGAG